jgi:hypothetical protein
VGPSSPVRRRAQTAQRPSHYGLGVASQFGRVARESCSRFASALLPQRDRNHPAPVAHGSNNDLAPVDGLPRIHPGRPAIQTGLSGLPHSFSGASQGRPDRLAELTPIPEMADESRNVAQPPSDVAHGRRLVDAEVVGDGVHV